jgi:aminoglycoside phosphotransferase family enzyme
VTGAADWIDELHDPACYPHAPADVAVVQTHISVVCLAGGLVYKLKKAVTLPFLDFADPGRRLYFCREEVRLNRRLCPDVYLGVVSLRRTGAGLRFGPRRTRRSAPTPPAPPAPPAPPVPRPARPSTTPS